MTDPNTGRRVRAPEKVCGILTIEKVFDKYSVAKLDSGLVSMLKPGMNVVGERPVSMASEKKEPASSDFVKRENEARERESFSNQVANHVTNQVTNYVTSQATHQERYDPDRDYSSFVAKRGNLYYNGRVKLKKSNAHYYLKDYELYLRLRKARNIKNSAHFWSASVFGVATLFIPGIISHINAQRRMKNIQFSYNRKYPNGISKDVARNEQRLIESELERRRVRSQRRAAGMMLAGQILSTVGSTIQTMTNTNGSNYHNNSYSGTNSSGTSSSSSTTGRKQVTCSACKGTGQNPAKERPSFYNYNEETYSNSPCSVCGDRSNHYHKTCPSCLGKGYKETF